MPFFYAFLMVLTGKITAAVASGFGAEYTAAFYATQLVRVLFKGKGSCDNRNLSHSQP